MSEISPNTVEAEAPVNPYSLLEAVNSSSDTAHSSWLIFLGLMAYMMVAVAGVSHQDLLLNNEITLPIIQVSIKLTHFFIFAPVVMVLIHLGVITQLVMLSRKAIEFDGAMRLLEVSSKRAHPLRLELHNFFFVQAIAGPERSRVMGLFLHMMTWLTLAILPMLLLLFIQIVFLPYHDVMITWVHRLALVAEMLVLATIGVFLVRAEVSFFSAFMRTAMHNPLSFMITAILLISVTFFSFFIATVPGERMAKLAEKFFKVDRVSGAASNKNYLIGFTMPFIGASSDGTLFGLFYRNLVVTDVDLVKDKEVTANEPTLNLRGRDLRYARLDRSDLHQADFTGADLEGASLVRTDLRSVFMNCSNLDAMLLGDGREKANCTSARNADFTKANLTNANLLGLDLTGSVMEDVTMSDVNLSYAIMPGVNFSGAHMERADLTGGVVLQGAMFQLAALQGANMLGANLQGADLNNASLQGAILSWALLDGASLSEANLNGADFSKVSLRGANLGNAKLRGTDFRGAFIWETSPPNERDVALSVFSKITMSPLGTSEREGIKAQLLALSSAATRTRVADALTSVMDLQSTRRWASTAARGRWDAIIQSPPPGDGLTSKREQITIYLSGLMCDNPWRPGAVATGLIRQATNSISKFRANASALYARLTTRQCSAAKGVPSALINDLATGLLSAPPQ